MSSYVGVTEKNQIINKKKKKKMKKENMRIVKE